MWLGTVADARSATPWQRSGDLAGTVDVNRGNLPDGTRVRVARRDVHVPGQPVFAAIKKGRFRFDGLPAGVYDVTLVLPNRTPFAAAGTTTVTVTPDHTARVTISVPEGRVGPPAINPIARALERPALTVATGATLAVALCGATDCLGTDDDGDTEAAASPSTL